MTAYVVVGVEVKDEAVFSEVRERAATSARDHGGRFLARGGDVELIEGHSSPDRVAIIEFDDTEKARTWINSSEYTDLKKIRQQAANATVLLVEGV